MNSYIKKIIDSFKTSKPTQNISSDNPIQKLTASSTGRNFLTAGNTRRSGGKSAQGLSRYQKHLVIDHWATRQNTRVTVHESTQARTILRRINDTIIGAGLTPDPSPLFNIIGITREEAKEWSDNLKERFKLWAESKDSDLAGHNNFNQNQGFYQWQFDRDGEPFVRFSYNDDPKLLSPLQISFIDPNQIRGDEFTTSLGPSTQDDGIIKDENGKTTGYKVWINDPESIGRFKFIEIDAFDKKTGRPLMIHGFKPEYPGQTRGIPEISYSLQEFEDITSFDVATGKKRIMEATLGMFVENKQQTPSDMGFSSINSGGRAGLPLVISEESAPATPQNLGLDRVSHCEIAEATVTEPGTVHAFSGQQGDEFKAIPSATPAEKTADYIDFKTKHLAAAQSIPITIALMQMSKSHSASRAEFGMYADVIEIKVDEIAADFLNIVWGAWVAEEIAAGRVQAPGFSDPIIRSAWLNINWIGNPLPDVDPLKTLQAKKLATEMGWSDLDKEAMLYNGSSGEANRAKLATQLPELVTDPFEIKAMEQQQEIIDDQTDDDESEDN